MVAWGALHACSFLWSKRQTYDGKEFNATPPFPQLASRTHHAAYRRRAAITRPAPPPYTVDLFVRTYIGDGGWLVYLLRSLEKNLAPSAYRTLHLVTDVGADADFVEGLLPLVPKLRTRLHAQTVERWMTSRNNGSYHAQVGSTFLVIHAPFLVVADAHSLTMTDVVVVIVFYSPL